MNAALTRDPQQYGRLVWLVPSGTSEDRTYLVDLTAHDVYGECSCPDWSCRRWPNIKAKAPMGTRATMCRDVEAMRTKFLNDLCRDLARSETQPLSR